MFNRDHDISHRYHCTNLISPNAICLTDQDLTSLLAWRFSHHVPVNDGCSLEMLCPTPPSLHLLGIWQACGWRQAWNSISFCLSAHPALLCLPSPSHARLIPSISFRWGAGRGPHTYHTIEATLLLCRTITVSVQFIITTIPKPWEKFSFCIHSS